MLPRPTDCDGCPLNDKAQGFSRPEGTGALGVMIVGDALGEEEARDGLPFRPKAQAGSLLERIFTGCRMDRQQFTIWNAVACRPPNNWLEGAPWEAGAIEHCRRHFKQVMEQVKPRALLTLGNVPLRALTGHAGKKRGVSYMRGYPLEALDYPSVPVIPSYHPAFIRRGAAELIGVLSADLLLACRIAREGFVKKPVTYQVRPSMDEALAFLARAKAQPDTLLAYDIETPYSRGMAEDEREEDVSYEIISIQFSLASQEGIFFPWQEPYIGIARELLSLPNPKANHNTWKYDIPRLAAKGCPLNGVSHDTLWLFHHIQPDLPAHLQFAASFAGMDFPWKHLDNSDPELYGCADVDAVQRLMAWAPAEMKRLGIERGYDRHVVRLEPILAAAAKRGVPVNDQSRRKFKAELRLSRLRLWREIQALVPDAVRSAHPKAGYKKPPKVLDGLVERDFPVEDGSLVKRWCRLESFSGNSSPQLVRYMKLRGHPVPIDFKKKTETTGEKDLERLAKKTADPLYGKVIEWRKASKMLSTYIEGWQPDAAGRVHTTFYYETGTGQLSSRGPNIQNGPKHGALARSFRRMIEAEPGHRLVEFDYRSFHALTLGFEARDPDYMRAARHDIHSLVSGHVLKLHEAQRVLEKQDDELDDYFKWYKSSDERRFHRDKKAKPSILGYGFGLQARKLYQMNLESFESEREAKEVLAMLDRIFPRTAAYRTAIRQKAHEQSFLLSRHGYLRRFYDVYRKRWSKMDHCFVVSPGDDSEKAIAFLPANDAFGHIKDVMLRLDEEDVDWNERAEFINTVHDSLVYHVPDAVFDEAVPAIYREMTQASEVLVDPLVAPDGLAVDVEAKVGRNWQEMEPIMGLENKCAKTLDIPPLCDSLQLEAASRREANGPSTIQLA